jgi:hypothetical protein
MQIRFHQNGKWFIAIHPTTGVQWVFSSWVKMANWALDWMSDPE